MKTISLLFLMTFSLIVNANEHIFGMSAGLNHTIPDVRGSGIHKDISGRSSQGVDAGLNYRYAFTNRFSFRSGISLSQKKIKYQTTTLRSYQEHFLETHFFVGIPLLIQYNPTEIIGGFGGIKVSESISSKCEGQSICSASDSGISLIAGVQINLGKNSKIDLAYEKRIGNLDESESFIGGATVGEYQVSYTGFNLSYVYEL